MRDSASERALFANALRLESDGPDSDAVRAYAALVKIQPRHGSAWLNLGLLHLAAGRLADALSALKCALKLRPDDPQAHRALARAYAANGDLAAAARQYDRAHRRAPRDADIAYDLAAALHSSGRSADAIKRYRQAIALDPRLAAAYNDLGILYREMGRFDDALAMFDGAVKADPSVAVAWFNLGGALRESGRFDEARVAYEAAVDLSPRCGEFLYQLAESRTFRADDPYRRLMLDLVRSENPVDGADMIGLLFALGKSEADLGDHTSAFGYYARGNILKRAQQPYDEAAVLGELAVVARAFTPELHARLRQFADPARRPIFVVGMPRCGSTLISQILHSHPDVMAVGEIPDFRNAFASIRQRLGGECAKVLSTMDAADAAQLTGSYLDRIAAYAPGAERVVDKALINFRLVGVINALLPNATIIHVRRNPLDTCWSCYEKLFADYQPFAYDLAELGRYYAAYAAVMEDWQDVLPEGSIVDIQYEHLVGDFEPTCRRLIEQCGLAWNDRCLEFHRTQRWVRTSSASQVRKPLYDSSVGRAQAYARVLGPLTDEVAHLL